MAENEKKYQKVQCCHCEGAGCTYCEKRGYVLIRPPARCCPHCEGAGCIYCGFTGWADLKGKYEE